MPDTSASTAHRRPLPPRPQTGLLAWQATLGYISSHLAPDATLKIQTFSREARVMWSAAVTWGGVREAVDDKPSLAAALRDLWTEVSRNHQIFEHLEDAAKSPMGYEDSDWLDMATQESLQRLVWVTQIVFPGDWLLLIVYQPVERPAGRVQMRLVAKGNTVTVGGRGATLLDACRTLFRNATPYYSTGTPVNLLDLKPEE